MSVTDVDTVDGIAVTNDGKTLKLLITDHLKFKDDEAHHLLTLQEKLNSYLGFIESEQYRKVYPESDIDNVIIEIHFKYKISDNCKKFIDVVNNQIGALNTVCVIVQ
ncbi:MAG: branched-chain amino acid ABC transporter substrate-binding protein [Clostridia bacterium]|nr:branched-chain amino acid ABC transporter substrate-binding protein [Clostridia bacterium]